MAHRLRIIGLTGHVRERNLSRLKTWPPVSRRLKGKLILSAEAEACAGYRKQRKDQLIQNF